MDKVFTARLAIAGVDFDSVELSLVFRIFESFTKEIHKISLFETSDLSKYAIAEFSDAESAVHVYDFVDGTEIENTGTIFDLSFVPNDCVFDNPIEECTSSENHRMSKLSSRTSYMDDPEIEMSEEIADMFEVPEEFRSVPEEPVKKTKQPHKSEIEAPLSKKKSKEEEQDDGFVFNISDKRFEAIFNEDDFLIDASNKKAKAQKVSGAILEKKLKKDNSTD